MIEIGKINKLTVLRTVDFGIYLDAEEGVEILLPSRYVPESCGIGEQVEVFIYYDSDDRLIATTDRPLTMVGEFAVLKVASVESIGAFLDWGLPKDLFLPFAEQNSSIRPGQNVIVYIYLDNTGRIAASMRLDRHVDKTPGNYKEGQPVQLLITGKTDLGYKALIEGRHWGLLYENEVFQHLSYGQKINGFIKTIREDGKVDLALNQTGHKAADATADKIVELLKSNGGFLAINDKTAPEQIYKLFGVSKKKYKIALGGLFKKKIVFVNDQGIKLL